MNGDGDSSLVPVSLCEQGANVPTSASDNKLAKLPRIVVKSCLPRGKVMSFKFVASLTNNPACSNLHERRQSSASFFLLRMLHPFMLHCLFGVNWTKTSVE